MNRPDDLITVLAEDHRELRQLFTELEMLSGGENLRRMLTDQLIIEMVRHSVAEEAYLYPVCRAHLTDGGWISEEAHADHQRIEKIMKQLEEPGLPDDHFSFLLDWLIRDARRHMSDEEDRVFPLLVKNVSEAELVVLGEKAKRAKRMAPTRPSGAGKGMPLLHTLLESGAGLVERARAYLCGHGKAYP
ncbi:MAG TPA: hemerythrin domain-containing protein [Actinoallomurus sp.]|jgi:hemerythrin superfamily protein